MKSVRESASVAGLVTYGMRGLCQSWESCGDDVGRE